MKSSKIPEVSFEIKKTKMLLRLWLYWFIFLSTCSVTHLKGKKNQHITYLYVIFLNHWNGKNYKTCFTQEPNGRSDNLTKHLSNLLFHNLNYLNNIYESRLGKYFTHQLLSMASHVWHCPNSSLCSHYLDSYTA